MQLVARRKGVDFINDSKATNVGAAVASIKSIEGTVVLIAGGEAKGGDFNNWYNNLPGYLQSAYTREFDRLQTKYDH